MLCVTVCNDACRTKKIFVAEFVRIQGCTFVARTLTSSATCQTFHEQSRMVTYRSGAGTKVSRLVSFELRLDVICGPPQLGTESRSSISNSSAKSVSSADKTGYPQISQRTQIGNKCRLPNQVRILLPAKTET